MRKSGSTRKSRNSARSGFFSGTSSGRKKKPPRKEKAFFSRKYAKNSSMGKSGKTHRVEKEEEKERFVKPPHDPGLKIREEEGEVEVVEEYSVEENGEAVQQALQNTGRGCCSSITGFLWFIGLGGLAVVIILALKCGGC